MKRILVVEDEIAIRDLIKIGLELQGYQCECAKDGEIAADLIEQKSFNFIGCYAS